MSSFYTSVQVPKAAFNISHQDTLLSIGSCFAQNIGERLEGMKFKTLHNPFGILYNPMSIAKNLARLIKAEVYSKEAFFEHQGLWHHFDFHSQFSAPTLDQAITNTNQAIFSGHLFLQKTNCLILTFGTANVFVHKATNAIVANCHKVPNQHFARKRLDAATIQATLASVLQKLKSNYPQLKVLFTVSPIRHIRDGLVENQRSKATLLLAIDALVEQLEFAYYFPAYELVLDELRDYRFYEADMIHPNEVAIDFVWEKFAATYFDTTTTALLKKIKAIVTASQHRPFNADTPQHQLFLEQQLKKITALEKDSADLDFAKEKERFNAQLLLP